MVATSHRPLNTKNAKITTFLGNRETVFYDGSFLGFVPGTNYVRPLQTGDRFAGIVDGVSPAPSTDSDLRVSAVVGGVCEIPYSSAATSNIGSKVYLSDSNTISFTSGPSYLGSVENVTVGQFLNVLVEGVSSSETYYSFRGEIRLDTYPGVVTGSVSAEQRVLNFTAIQAAITEAYTNKKRLVAPPATYEIDGAGGLVVPAGYNGFEWKGSKQGTIIIQFASNTPVFTVGVAGGAECAGVTIDGLSVMYGVDQTGNTSASAFKIGKVWKCYFRNITANSDGSFKPYYACHIAGNSFYFSNTMEDCSFRDAQVTSLYVQNFGTGNIFRNLYVTKGGAPTATDISGPVVRFDTGGGAQYENVIEQLNIEWSKGNNALQMQQCRNMTFISTHFEGIKQTTTNGAFIKMTGSQVTFIGLTFLNCSVLTADGAATAAYIFFGDYRCDVSVTGFTYWQDNQSYAGCDVPFYLTNHYSPDPHHHNNFTVRNLVIVDSKTSTPTLNQFRITPTVTDAGYRLSHGNYLRLAEVFVGPALCRVHGGFADITDADKTLYGFAYDMMYQVPAALAAERSITLSNRVGPAATRGANVPLPAGQSVSVYRAGTVSGSNALVKNHNGTTLATLSTSKQLEHFFFNGTDWVKI